VLHAAVPPILFASVLPLAAQVGAALSVLDAGARFRKRGNGSALAVVELLVGLLLFVSAFAPVHPFVSTTIPVLPLTLPLEAVVIVLLLQRASRKGGLVWLTIAAVVVNGVTAALSVLR
jgi:predicted transporter